MSTFVHTGTELKLVLELDCTVMLALIIETVTLRQTCHQPFKRTLAALFPLKFIF